MLVNSGMLIPGWCILGLLHLGIAGQAKASAQDSVAHLAGRCVLALTWKRMRGTSLKSSVVIPTQPSMRMNVMKNTALAGTCDPSAEGILRPAALGSSSPLPRASASRQHLAPTHVDT